MFVVLISDADMLAVPIGPFDSKELAEQYLEKQGWSCEDSSDPTAIYSKKGASRLAQIHQIVPPIEQTTQ